MKPFPKTIFLTGASGFIGRYLLRDLLLQGNRVVVLSRRKGLYSARDRIESILQDWENKLQRRLIRPLVVEGDVRETLCGLSESIPSVTAKSKKAILPRELQQIDMFLHSAASLRFTTDASGEEPLRTNLEGVRNALELARRLSIPQFHHISTAYVCGKRGTEQVLEDDLDVGQEFQNIYEQSKMQAEKLVQEATGFETKTIYRPSIVVGDSETGFTSTFTTIYSLLRFLRALPSHNAYDTEWVLSRLQLTGNEGKNLVPVDWVSQRVLDVMSRPQFHNRTIHLTNPVKAFGQHIREAIQEAIVIAKDQWQAMASRTESGSESIELSDEAFSVHLDAYRGYMADDPNFVPSKLGTERSQEKFWQDPLVYNKQNLVKLFVYAINSKFRDTTPHPTPTQDAKASGMDHSLPIGSWIDQFLDRLESKKSRKGTSLLDCAAFQLRLAGTGGGAWIISNRSLEGAVGGAFVHLSVESWCELLQGGATVAELLTHRKLILSASESEKNSILELLEELIEDSQKKLSLEQASEVPSVLPIEQHRKGGRRLA